MSRRSVRTEQIVNDFTQYGYYRLISVLLNSKDHVILVVFNPDTNEISKINVDTFEGKVLVY